MKLGKRHRQEVEARKAAKARQAKRDRRRERELQEHRDRNSSKVLKWIMQGFVESGHSIEGGPSYYFYDKAEQNVTLKSGLRAKVSVSILERQ